MVAAGIVSDGEREAVGAGRRFTVDEYLALGAAGILAKEERVELLDGEIIQMAPIGNRHLNSVDWVARSDASESHRKPRHGASAGINTTG